MFEEDVSTWMTRLLDSDSVFQFASAKKGFDEAMTKFSERQERHLWNIRFRELLLYEPEILFDFLNETDDHPLDHESKVMIQYKLTSDTSIKHQLLELVSYFNLIY